MRKLWIIGFLLAAACSESNEMPGVDAPVTCLPSGSCGEGPPCGAGCCGVGERCVNSVCRCGAGPACSGIDTCEAAGPIGLDGCGSICCGSGPCPQ